MIVPLPNGASPDVRSTQSLRRRAHELIPGGCHTYAKGDDQYPQIAPSFIVRGKGCHVWDLEGNEYIEYGMGNRCVTLGHAYEPVIQAAWRAMLDGANFPRPSPLEVECAERFLELIDGAEMVKFAKNGSDATTAAVKLARASTGRDMVAVCADHPFFSVDDWFIGTTPLDAGIPEAIQRLTVSFRYNDLPSVESLFDRYPHQIAAIILEAAKNEEPRDGFLHKAQELCHRHGAVFILDEMITGFRWHNGGAQKRYGLTPDLSTFGKGMGNGFAIAALAGRRSLMELGGLEHNRERVFLLSTTHGGETHALAAALAVMKVYREEPVIETLERQGQRLAHGLRQVIARRQLADYVQIAWQPGCMVHVALDQSRRPSQSYRTLLMQEMVRRGVIMPSLVVSYSHTDDDIDRTIDAWDEALAVYQQAVDGGVERFLIGQCSKTVYRKYN